MVGMEDGIVRIGEEVSILEVAKYEKIQADTQGHKEFPAPFVLTFINLAAKIEVSHGAE